jgi:hypothetical protein
MTVRPSRSRFGRNFGLITTAPSTTGALSGATLTLALLTLNRRLTLLALLSLLTLGAQ